MSLVTRMMLATSLICGARGAAFAADAQASQTPAVNATQVHWLSDEQTGCKAPDPDFAEGDDIVWSGACLNGIVSGQGTLTFLNKSQPQVTITGMFANGDLAAGKASFAWPDGSKYDGEQVGGKFNGRGVFISAQQDRLDGEWKDGALNGHAIVSWANGNRYEGGWLNGKAEGHGVEVWANGDRYDGEWDAGKARGHGVQVWANGQSYDGEWSDDQPNGTGKLVRPDGTTYSGRFVDGHPQGATDMAATTMPAAQVTANAAPTATPTAGALPVAAVADGQSVSPHHQLDAVEGKKLVAVDGSSIALSESDDGFTRAIAKPDGTGTTTAFTFVNDRMGTVADAADPERVTGLFKVSDADIAIDYSDGRSEVLRPGAGGVALSMRAPDGRSTCMAWYPEGHVFSETERRAALAEYANKLGIALKGAGSKAAAHVSACSLPAPAALKSATVSGRNLPHPLPRPIQASFVVPAAPVAVATQPLAQQAIVVRASQVHPIDLPKPVYAAAAGGQSAAAPAPAPAAIPATTAAALPSVAPSIASGPALAPAAAVPSAASAMPAQPTSAAYEPDTSDPGASSCLSVASDGTHWGFRNSCSYSVQFAYCLKGDTELLASCKDGAIAGSAAPGSFSALVADASMKEKNIDHGFRWVACGGGAGEVIPKLDAVDPPSGRCMRARTAEK